MTRITFIGAGSLGFTANLVRDLLTFPLLEDATLESVYGHPFKADSPWVILGGWREAEAARWGGSPLPGPRVHRISEERAHGKPKGLTGSIA